MHPGRYTQFCGSMRESITSAVCVGGTWTQPTARGGFAISSSACIVRQLAKAANTRITPSSLNTAPMRTDSRVAANRTHSACPEPPTLSGQPKQCLSGSMHWLIVRDSRIQRQQHSAMRPHASFAPREAMVKAPPFSTANSPFRADLVAMADLQLFRQEGVFGDWQL